MPYRILLEVYIVHLIKKNVLPRMLDIHDVCCFCYVMCIADACLCAGRIIKVNIYQLHSVPCQCLDHLSKAMRIMRGLGSRHSVEYLELF